MLYNNYKKINAIITKIQYNLASDKAQQDADFLQAMQILNDAIIKIEQLNLNKVDYRQIKIKPTDWQDIKNMRDSGYKLQQIADIYGVSRQCIQQGLKNI